MTASFPDSLFASEKDRVIARFTSSWWYDRILNSLKHVLTSSAFRVTKYSSKQRDACCLNCRRSTETTSSISANSGLDFFCPALSRFSGTFERNARSTTSARMHPCRMLSSACGAAGTSIAMSSHVTNNFSKLRIMAELSMMPDLWRLCNRAPTDCQADSSQSSAVRMARTPSSSASDGQSVNRSRMRRVVSSITKDVKYSLRAPLTASWNLLNVQCGGSSRPSSSSSPKVDEFRRAGRTE
mmetsp:Transcript_124670/g.248856  ORF Transcript_124670/g.248856 Transcript_124670/m.248856 type:complete len:241 (-) Transcript_124670:171-893(-)